MIRQIIHQRSPLSFAIGRFLLKVGVAPEEMRLRWTTRPRERTAT
jgi:hypothetical protein